MDENYYKTLKCPICGTPLYCPEDRIIEITHFTTCKFDWGSSWCTGEYGSERIAYCHIGNGFVRFNIDGKHHKITKLPISNKLLIETISEIKRSELDIEQFVTNHEFSKKHHSGIDTLSQHKLYNNIKNKVYKLIKNTQYKSKPLKCKLGLHHYTPGDYDVLLICSKCHKPKIDWRKVPIFDTTTRQMMAADINQ